MNTWAEDLDEVLSGDASAEQFINAVSYWTHSVELAINVRSDAVSKRVLREFPNGMAFSIGANFRPTMYKTDQPWPEGEGLEAEPDWPDWKFARFANGWELDIEPSELEAEKLAEILNKLSAEYGQPKLVLPWDDVWTSLVDEYFEHSGEDDEELEEEEAQTAGKLMNAVLNGDIAKVSPWEIQLEQSEYGISKHSDLARLDEFLKRVETENLAIIHVDDHYEGCVEDEYARAVERNSGLAGKPVLSNCLLDPEWQWRGNGAVYIDFEVDDENLLVQLKRIAGECGLDAQKGNTSFQYDSQPELS